MRADDPSTRASLIVAATGALWGLYWVPVRRMAEFGLAGPWGTLAIVAAAALAIAPFALSGGRLRKPDPWTLGFVALGGAAFVLYSVGFVYGRVAIIILLFFLTPVWSVLIGRVVLGWPTPRLRLAAIGVGLAGLAVMLGADGAAPVPRGTGEWLALLSGLLWSIATTGVRVRPTLDARAYAFVFALGACAGALALALVLPPPGAEVPLQVGPATFWALATGCLWWGVSIAALIWAAARLEPARVGLLLMSEVLVGAVSAAIIAGERLGALEILGGGLVLLAGALEIWPARARVGTGKRA